MTDKETIDNIIDILKEVEIEETRIEEEKARLTKDQRKLSQERSRLIESLQQKRRKETTRPRVPTPSQARTAQQDDVWKRLSKFRIRDRVQIINRITVPRLRKANQGDRTATVTSITYDRTNKNKNIVHIRTDNGSETWRHEENLQLLEPSST